MEANKIKISTLIIALLLVAAVEIIVGAVIEANFVAPLFGLGMARLTEIIFLLIWIKVNEKTFAIIGLMPTDVGRGFKKGLIWAVTFGVAAGAILLILYFLGINVISLFQVQFSGDSHSLVAFFLTGALVAPLAEEIFFRGILYGFFRRWGIWAAIVLSTLLFVLSHTTANTLPVTQLIGGVLFAVAYEFEKNLLVPITIHILGNLAIFTLAAII